MGVLTILARSFLIEISKKVQTNYPQDKPSPRASLEHLTYIFGQIEGKTFSFLWAHLPRCVHQSERIDGKEWQTISP